MSGYDDRPSMLPPEGAIGGRDDPERPTSKIDSYGMDGVGRDAQTDARTQTEIAGKMSDELDMAGWLCDSRVETVMQEKRDDGWDQLARPVGADPMPICTSDTRGSGDIASSR